MGSRNNKPGRIVKGTAKQPTLKDASGVWTLDEAMQAHRANAWPQPNLFQPVANSLRIKQLGAATTAGVLSKPTVREGDRRRHTMSMWVKLGALTVPGGSIRTLFEGFTGFDNTYWLIYVTSGNQLYIGRDDNGAPSGTTVTWAGVLRDPNAWYHLVFATDTLQATAANRVKVWINGVQQTLGGDFPTQGYATTMGAFRDRNSTSITNSYGPGIRIGSRWNLTYDQNFDGLYSEVTFVDGYAVDPSLFGKFDTNNTWVPVAYTGTYGTNGFYLPFNNATTSQTLGYDASLNGTTTYDADQDPYRGAVSLHLTGNGPAGGQNNTFTDSSVNNLAFTRNGTATQGSFSPFAFNTNAPYNPVVNGASAYFNGSTDYIYTASNALFNVGSNNVTVEAWIYITAFTQGASPFISTIWSLDGSGTNNTFCYVYRTGSIAVGINGTNEIASAAGVIALNAWYHTAVVRNGSTTTVYVNGVSVASNTTAVWAQTGARPFYVGSNPQNANYYLTGYISNVRFLMNTVLYTAAFAPMMRPFGTLTNNLLPFSEDISNSTWTAQSQNVSFTANAAIAPDGTPSATLIVPSTSSAGTNIAGLHDSPAGVNTFSIYAKSAGYRYIQCLHSRSAGSDSGYVTFDLTTGAVTNSSIWSGSVVNAGNGWYRLVATTSSLSGASSNSNVRWAFTDGSASRGPSFTGNGTSGVYFWGAQAELASSVGNYTPTPANYSTSPSLLLNFANAAVVDSAGANNIITSSGATITNSSKYGSGALTFNGTSDIVYADSGTSYTFGAANFTAEFWVYFNNVTATQCVASATNSGGSDAASPLGWTIRTSGVLGWEGYFGSTSFYGTAATPTAVVSANTWHHVATVRNSGEIIAFLNGRVIGRVSVGTAAMANPAGGVYIGRAGQYNGQYFNGSIDDFRITKGVARYTTDFTPPARALPEIGGKSFVPTNINAGVVQRFTLGNKNVVGAKIYHVTTAARSANYTVQYSDDNSTWTTAFGGVMSSMDGTVGIKVGTVTSGGSGTTGTGVWGAHLYWRYVEGSTVSGHHPRCSRIIFTDSNGRDFNFKVFVADNSSDVGEYQLGTQTGGASQGPTLTTSWTAPMDVTQVEVLVVAGGGAGGGGGTSTAGGAGGGAGGLIYNNQYPVVPGQTYTVIVGAGGFNGTGTGSGSTAGDGNNGNNSVFGNLIAIGGGGGRAAENNYPAGVAGKSGGSGGGASAYYTTAGGGGAGTAGQGFAGGTGASGWGGAGAGGGAGAIGGTGASGTTGSVSPTGGVGLQFGISGSPTYYAGGGGSGNYSQTAGAGGLGGGGNGNIGPGNANGVSGVPNTGGGGGGAGGQAVSFGGIGGSGIVIVRYTTAMSNISDTTTDNLVDSPTQYGHDTGAGGEVVGNYCTLNPIDTETDHSFSNGNLTLFKAASNWSSVRSTMAFSSGKWYFETTYNASWDYAHVGVLDVTVDTYAGQVANSGYVGKYAKGWAYQQDQRVWNNDINIGGSIGAVRAYAGDTAMVAVDMDTGKIWFGVNGVWFNSGNPAAGTNAAYSNLSGTVSPAFSVYGNSSGITVNFGQRAWAYAPPAGFNALTTKNFPRLELGSPAANPNQYFDVSIWTQGATDVAITNAGGFQPDLVWIKSRSNSQNHYLLDSVRGTTSLLRSNGTGAESTGSTWITFNSNGFTPSSANTVTNTYTYVAWQWKAGGAAVSNTNGTITSQVSVNTASGFSIVSYSGTGAQATVGHGLSTTPGFIIIKSRTNATRNWAVYHSSFVPGEFMYLNLTGAKASDNSAWGTVNSTTFQLGNVGIPNTSWNEAGNTFIAYCWTEVPGFSKFGTYSGNGSTDGPFVYCGFKPRWVMVKQATGTNAATGAWQIFDTARDTYNPCDFRLRANDVASEGTGAPSFDITANGFKLRSTNSNWNESGGSATYIFMAFADKPFGNVNGTAR